MEDKSQYRRKSNKVVKKLKTTKVAIPKSREEMLESSNKAFQKILADTKLVKSSPKAKNSKVKHSVDLDPQNMTIQQIRFQNILAKSAKRVLKRKNETRKENSNGYVSNSMGVDLQNKNLKRSNDDKVDTNNKQIKTNSFIINGSNESHERFATNDTIKSDHKVAGSIALPIMPNISESKSSSSANFFQISALSTSVTLKQEIDENAKLVLFETEVNKDCVAPHEIKLIKNTILIGCLSSDQNVDNHISCKNSGIEIISRKHALLTKVVNSPSNGSIKYVISDMGSINGLFVNNQKISNHELKNNDIIQFGGTVDDGSNSTAHLTQPNIKFKYICSSEEQKEISEIPKEATITSNTELLESSNKAFQKILAETKLMKSIPKTKISTVEPLLDLKSQNEITIPQTNFQKILAKSARRVFKSKNISKTYDPVIITPNPTPDTKTAPMSKSDLQQILAKNAKSIFKSKTKKQLKKRFQERSKLISMNLSSQQVNFQRILAENARRILKFKNVKTTVIKSISDDNLQNKNLKRSYNNKNDSNSKKIKTNSLISNISNESHEKKFVQILPLSTNDTIKSDHKVDCSVALPLIPNINESKINSPTNPIDRNHHQSATTIRLYNDKSQINNDVKNINNNTSQESLTDYDVSNLLLALSNSRKFLVK